MADQPVKKVVAYSGGLDIHHRQVAPDRAGRRVATFTADLGQGEEVEPAPQGHHPGVKPVRLRRGRARGVRARLHLPDVPGNTVYEGQYLGHLDRAAADRQEADRDRPEDRRRRRRPRRDRQGQRPGALRDRLLCARTRHPRRGPLARVGLQEPRGPAGLRREAPDPDHQGQARRGALQRRRQPSALLLRGEGAGRPCRGGPRVRPHAHDLARGGARQAHRLHDGLRERRPRGHRRPEAVARRPADEAQPARSRQRRGPARSGREPLCRDEVAGRLRDARRHDLLHAHRGMESITLDRSHAPEGRAMPKYASLIYNGFWFAPERGCSRPPSTCRRRTSPVRCG